MTIRNRTEVPHPQEFYEDISKCGNIMEIAKVVQRAVGDLHMVLKPAYKT